MPSPDGTVGLTGRNIPGDEVNAMMAREEVLPANERLARFSSMFNSGGNTTGQGLFGAGKSVYSVASDDYTYYFDSLREDGLYVANVNAQGQVYPLAFEEDEAKAFILKETGLPAKTTPGTRVIIKSPKAELVDSITSGEIIPYIQESWWLIISRLGTNSSISVNGIPVTVPEGIKNGTHIFDLPATEPYASNYRVKHFGFYVFQNGGNVWDTVSYYRRGMKIGEIELKDIPEKLKGKFWGYIEVDEAWELELADIEDKVHFGVSKGKRKTTTYQNLNVANSGMKLKFLQLPNDIVELVEFAIYLTTDIKEKYYNTPLKDVDYTAIREELLEFYKKIYEFQCHPDFADIKEDILENTKDFGLLVRDKIDGIEIERTRQKEIMDNLEMLKENAYEVLLL